MIRASFIECFQTTGRPVNSTADQGVLSFDLHGLVAFDVGCSFVSWRSSRPTTHPRVLQFLRRVAEIAEALHIPAVCTSCCHSVHTKQHVFGMLLGSMDDVPSIGPPSIFQEDGEALTERRYGKRAVLRLFGNFVLPVLHIDDDTGVAQDIDREPCLTMESEGWCASVSSF